jgi:hypothetical protein
MSKRQYSFDTRCYDLAEHFLPNTDNDIALCDLAQDIQNAVENWFVGRNDDGTLAPTGDPNA